jgi:hypothetical protein
LRQFDGGEEKYVHWTFWPSTVFTAHAARDLTRLFATNKTLQDVMRRSKIWATEEVVLPTVIALLGYEIAKNPASYDYVKYRAAYTTPQIDAACAREDVYWIHPVPRRYDHPLRLHTRTKFHHYELAPEPSAPTSAQTTGNGRGLLLTTSILRTMNGVKGWLEDEEADLLIAASRSVLEALPLPHAIVEIGSYQGRSTVVLGSVAKVICPEAVVYAIDPHEGAVGALDDGIQSHPPTLEAFKNNIANAGLTNQVKNIQRRSVDVAWDRPISFLFIDGLHDYPNVAGDYWHFHEWLRPGGVVAFHDYAEYYPGVIAFVNELLGLGEYQLLGQSKSLVALKRRTKKTTGFRAVGRRTDILDRVE